MTTGYIAKVCSLAVFLESFPKSWIFHRRRCFTSPAGKTDWETRRRFCHFVRARTDRLKGCRARSCGDPNCLNQTREACRACTRLQRGRTDIRSTVTSLIAILSVGDPAFETGIKSESHFDRLYDIEKLAVPSINMWQERHTHTQRERERGGGGENFKNSFIILRIMSWRDLNV